MLLHKHVESVWSFPKLVPEIALQKSGPHNLLNLEQGMRPSCLLNYETDKKSSKDSINLDATITNVNKVMEGLDLKSAEIAGP